jgi:uncharacterized membrane protein HdeD (DUF308 family)
MESERPEATHQSDKPFRMPLGWGASFVLGLITLILGVIVTARPAQSLTVIAVLLGVTAIVSGVYHIVRAFDGREHERVWRGISGVLFILVGLALIRHLHLTVALIGLFIGFTWIVQGISALMEGASRGREGTEGRGWLLFFGVISLIAGIVVISSPITSIAALTIFMGVWFIVMGLMEMVGALLLRRALRRGGTGRVSVPGQRASEAETGERADQAAQSRHE